MSKVIELDNDIIIWGVVVGPFANQDLPDGRPARRRSDDRCWYRDVPDLRCRTRRSLIKSSGNRVALSVTPNKL